ncbi:hypothetical protein F2P81_003992 [Scophthalmus maximus]|uniref:Uncharacterized protein n=1 Tax=Scophthalmus maximus TaxID=52904 RepID=A0A6A4TNK7_SCOMX|nr:hypothetical protein F2P81_003992 [Scophthalmus maximus]
MSELLPKVKTCDPSVFSFISFMSLCRWIINSSRYYKTDFEISKCALEYCFCRRLHVMHSPVKPVEQACPSVCLYASHPLLSPWSKLLRRTQSVKAHVSAKHQTDD